MMTAYWQSTGHPMVEPYAKVIAPEGFFPESFNVDTSGLNLVKLGTAPRDCLITGHITYYCLPEHREEAKKKFEEIRKRMMDWSDSYYSRPWV